ncbi:MAG: succinylglutamate desuccinylase/aspartoacylase family protein [Alkalispirochaeta sp.]
MSRRTTFRRTIFLTVAFTIGVTVQSLRGDDFVSGTVSIDDADGTVTYFERRGPRGMDDGGSTPTVVIVSGIHGNERSGPVAARRILEEVDLLRGQLFVVPVANPGAYATGTRRSPDGGDLNRRFPEGDALGNEAGTDAAPEAWAGESAGVPDGDIPTDRLARSLLARIVAWQPDVVIDFHESDRYWKETPGAAVVLPPSGVGSEVVLDLLEQPELGDFGFTGSPPAGSLVHALDRRGIPAYIVEVPRRYPVEIRVETYRRITVAVLHFLGMVSERPVR